MAIVCLTQQSRVRRGDEDAGAGMMELDEMAMHSQDCRCLGLTSTAQYHDHALPRHSLLPSQWGKCHQRHETRFDLGKRAALSDVAAQVGRNAPTVSKVPVEAWLRISGLRSTSVHAWMHADNLHTTIRGIQLRTCFLLHTSGIQIDIVFLNCAPVSCSL